MTQHVNHRASDTIASLNGEIAALKTRAEAAEKELAVVIAERDRAIKATEEIGKQLEGYRIRTWGPETDAD